MGMIFACNVAVLSDFRDSPLLSSPLGWRKFIALAFQFFTNEYNIFYEQGRLYLGTG